MKKEALGIKHHKGSIRNQTSQRKHQELNIIYSFVLVSIIIISYIISSENKYFIYPSIRPSNIYIKVLSMQQAYVQFNQDFDSLLFVKSGSEQSTSPIKGFSRVLLQRRGDAVPRRTTSIVTYEPQSSFPSHTHTFGQQFLVLQGVFSDHTGDYSTNWYVRNAVKSAHAPFSKQGSKVFVKLGQMPVEQTSNLQLNTNILDYKPISQSVRHLILYESLYEAVSLYKLTKGGHLEIKDQKQIHEILMVSGKANILEMQLQKESWVRIPKNTQFTIEALQDSQIYVKKGKGIVRDKDWNML